MRAVVTGAGGFIGRATVEGLRAAGHVCAAPGLDRPRVDVTDVDAVRRLFAEVRPEAIVHAAWYGGDDRIASTQNETWVGHTRRVLEEFVEAGGRRVVTVGTCFEYHVSDDPLLEDVTPIDPHTVYGRAKAEVSSLVADLSAATVVCGVHARVGFVYGPGERPPRLVPALVLALSNGERFASTSGTQRRDYCYVGDVGRALALLAANDYQGAVNVGSGSAIPVAELISAFASELEATDRIDLGALPQRPGDPAVIELSIRRLRNMGWEPEVGLTEGVRRTVRSMLSPEGNR